MKQFSNGCRATLLLSASLWISLSGCEALGVQARSPLVPSTETHVGPGKLTPDAIQSEVMSFADTFTGAVAQRWNEAASVRMDPNAAPDADWRARAAAHEHRLADVSAAVSIAASPNPVVTVADMITLVTLERAQLEEPRTAELFGAETAAVLVATYREQEEAIWRIGKQAFSDKQQAELHGMIDQWRTDHPDQRYLSQVRLEDFAPAREQQIPGKAEGGSLLSMLWLDPLSGLDPATREVHESRLLAARAYFQLTRMPTILKWQAESFYEGLLHAPEVEERLAAVDKFAEAASSIGRTAEELPQTLAAQRKATIDQFFAGVAEQRTALINDLDQGREKFHGTLKELRETIDATDHLAGSLASAAQAVESVAKQVMPEPGAPDPHPDRDGLAEYRASVEATGAAADRLSALAGKLEQLLEPAEAGQRGGALQEAVTRTRQDAEGLIDYAFLRFLILIIAVPLAIVLALVSYKWLAPRVRSDALGRAQRARG